MSHASRPSPCSLPAAARHTTEEENKICLPEGRAVFPAQIERRSKFPSPLPPRFTPTCPSPTPSPFTFCARCYLSSDEDDEEGAVEESSLPWALSPPAYGGGDFLDAADEVIPFPGDGKKPKSKRVNKKNSAVAAAVTSKKRPLVSSVRKRRSSSSSRDGPFSMEEAADDDSSPDEVGGSTGGSIHASVSILKCRQRRQAVAAKSYHQWFQYYL